MSRSAFRFILASCFLLAVAGCSRNWDASIQDILVMNNSRQVTVYAKVVNCFTKDMESAVLAGIPTTFVFMLDLYEEQPGFFDRHIAHMTINNTVKYDVLKKTFFISSSGDGNTTTEVHDVDSARKCMTELNGVAVAETSRLGKNKPYYIKIKAKLKKVKLPQHMDYLFFFSSLWDFETEWQKQRFILK